MTASSLTNRSLVAFMWGGAGSFLKLLIQIVAQIVLARMLGPEQYGLFAIGILVISFSNFFADIGLAYGLIQRQRITDQDIRFVSTWQVVLGVGVSFTIVGISEALAGFFSEPRAASILLALAPVCFIQAAVAVPLNLLKRNLNYKAIQIAQTLGYIIGYIAIGIPLAFAGWQVWALVVAFGAQAIVTAVLLVLQFRFPWKPSFWHPEARTIVRFGLKVLATNLINWFVANIDRLVIARNMPSTVIGLYATPYSLMFTPSSALMGVIQPVMYAACARVEGDSKRIGRAYLALIAAITVCLAPVFVAIASVSSTFMLALYGPRWGDAAEILRPIALAMPFFLLWNVTTPPLWTRGQSGLEYKMQLPVLVLWLFATSVAVTFSATAVAWTVFLLYVTRASVFFIAAARVIPMGAVELFGAARGGVLLSGVIGLTAWAVDKASGLLFSTESLARLMLVLAVCAAVWVVVIKWIPSVIHNEMRSLISHAVPRMPPRLAGGVNWLFGLNSRVASK